MATTLASLSSEAIGLIFDLVDAHSLFRAILIGNQCLYKKILSAVSRFDLAYVFGHKPQKWPRVLSSFLALEHVSIAPYSGYSGCDRVVIYGVDLLSLPSTLRSLKLEFANSFLCLATLPPSSYTTGPFTPRLRQELKDKFENLERLEWASDAPREWDCTYFAEDLYRWPLLEVSGRSCMPWFYVPLLRASQLTDSVYSLKVMLPTSKESEAEPLLSSSLLHLCLRKAEGPFNTVTKLELSFVTHLHNLTSLSVVTNPLETFDSELAHMLPRTLRSLSLVASLLELESFGNLPSELTELDVTFRDIVSSTTNKTLALRVRRSHLRVHKLGLPDSLLPTMRECVVAKLPRQLEKMAREIFELVKPADWDLLPRGLTTTFVLSLPSEYYSYVGHLPRGVARFEITKLCTPELCASLQGLLELHLCFTTNALTVGDFVPTTDDIATTIIATLEAISPHADRMERLVLDVEESFDLEHLHYLTAPNLKKLVLKAISRHSKGQLQTLKSSRRERTQTGSKVPACLLQLENLDFEWDAIDVFQYEIPRLFQACRELKAASFTVNGPHDPHRFPSAYLSLLPPKLENLRVHLDYMDGTTLKAIPSSVKVFNDMGSPTESLWKWKELSLLHRQFHYISIPLPKDEDDDSEAAIARLQQFANSCETNPQICLSGSAIYYPFPIPSILDLIEAERHTNGRLEG